MLHWNDLTEIEKEQAEDSLLTIAEYMADDGAEEDKYYYETLANTKDFRIKTLKECTFIREDDGYIFVNI